MQKIEEKIVALMGGGRAVNCGQNVTKLSVRDTVYTEPGYIGIKLWDTIICAIDTEKRYFTVNSGGWRTPTTKSRLHVIIQNLKGFGYGLRQRKGEWYLITPEGEVNFRDGMRLIY